MFHWFLRTDGDITRTLSRLILGVVFLAHGCQKMFGWWDGSGFFETLRAFEEQGVPIYLSFWVIFFELFGSIGLILGFLTRLCALGIGIIMSVAIATVHLPYGFFMNWYGTQKGEGYEYHLLALALCFTLLIRGAGPFSIDRSLVR